jgi:GntR family transcriptional regulator, transcriptional repressor for pyruvate dehydrogenase complex
MVMLSSWLGQSMKDIKLPKIQKATGSELAMRALLSHIREGIFRPGEQLPSERDLVTQMGLSRTGVREALRGLASCGVIEILSGRGAFVRRISPEMLVDSDSLLFILEREAILHAVEVRRILEVETIALAAERATGEDLAEMERVLRQVAAAVESDDNPLGQSSQFHLAVAKAAHNPVLYSMVKPFVRLITRSAPLIGKCVPESIQQEYPQHFALYEAVKQRNPEEARARMRTHLEVAKAYMLRSFPNLIGTPGVQEPATNPSQTEEKIHTP